MGTNYHLYAGICECCGKADAVYHIGKSSAGWIFLFQAYEFEEGAQPEIKTIEDWKVLLFNEHYKIYDEYDREWGVNDFWDLVQNKQKDETNRSHVACYKIEGEEWKDDQGYDFSLRRFS